MPPLADLYSIPLWREPLLTLEFAELLRSRTWRGAGVPHGNGQPVLLIPGFMAGDQSLHLLGRWLRKLGYHTERAGILANVDCSEQTVTRLGELLTGLSARHHGRKVVIVGHSRGGLMARVLAIRFPHLTAGIITLGSPHLGGLHDIHWLLKAQVETFATLGHAGTPGLFSHTCKPVPGSCCETFWAQLAGAFPPHVRFLSIYSRTDGVVGWRSCLDPAARHQEVVSTHCGMICNRRVFRAVADELARIAAAGAWDRQHQQRAVPLAA